MWLARLRPWPSAAAVEAIGRQISNWSRRLHSYLHAQAVGDGHAGCALLTAGGQRQLIALVVKAATGLITTQPTCEYAVRLVRAVAGAQLLSALASAQVERVRVSGARATANVVDGSQFQPQQVGVEQAGTTWKIAGVPGLSG